jgi:CheY-like chemotaxis protein
MTPRILLVEDDNDHADIIDRALGSSRIAAGIHRVADGEEALDYLLRRGVYADQALSPVPNVVLLDLRLPKVDGIEVLRVMKESAVLRSIPVAILTSSEAERDVAAAYSHHANSYLVKPVDFADFRTLMQTLGCYWLGWNRNPPKESAV